jgi:hypothetical protein
MNSGLIIRALCLSSLHRPRKRIKMDPVEKRIIKYHLGWRKEQNNSGCLNSPFYDTELQRKIIYNLSSCWEFDDRLYGRVRNSPLDLTLVARRHIRKHMSRDRCAIVQGCTWYSFSFYMDAFGEMNCELIGVVSRTLRKLQWRFPPVNLETWPSS